MENTLCVITCQYYDENGKPKFAQTFELRVDADMFMYAPTELIKDSLQRFIDDHWKINNYAGHCVYISHELVFNDPHRLPTGYLEDYMTRLYDANPSLYK